MGESSKLTDLKSDARELQAKKQEMRQIIIFVRRLYEIATEQGYIKMQGIWAIFDTAGCLVSRWGSCPGDNIPLLQEGACWSQKNVGTNAVTIGLQENRNCSTVGKENSSDALSDFGIWFSRITFQQQNHGFELVDYGGIAVIAPCGDGNAENFQALTSLLAHDIVLNLHCANIVTSLHSRQKYGMLFINTAVNPQDPLLVDYNPQFFDMAGIRQPGLSYIPLSDVIEDSPDNERFYQIVRGREWVKDEEISLMLRGHRKNFVVTSEPFEQKIVGGQGTILRFETTEHVAMEISRKVTNTALLTFNDIIGRSDCIVRAIDAAKIISQVDSNIMLLGESGVGKDVFAQAIHNNSRRGKPFVPVNCGALPRELIASELFGYSEGAFTGAKKQGNIGKFELANGGTIFLDEVGELPLDLQATLLRIVEQKQFTRLGDNRRTALDVKIICATNNDMQEMVEKRLFRADLFYRLSTMSVSIPPLRERGEDIILLAEHFIAQMTIKQNRIARPPLLSQSAKQFLLSLPYEGNVRELQGLMERVFLFCQKSVVEAEDIQELVHVKKMPLPAHNSEHIEETSKNAHINRRQQLTQEQIISALADNGYNREKAAAALGVSRVTLYRWMNRLGM